MSSSLSFYLAKIVIIVYLPGALIIMNCQGLSLNNVLGMF